jgi:hypothetical protein
LNFTNKIKENIKTIFLKNIQGGIFLADGGLCVDGSVFCRVDVDQIRETAERIRTSGIRNVVVSGLLFPFSKMGGLHETRILNNIRSEDKNFMSDIMNFDGRHKLKSLIFCCPTNFDVSCK